MPDLNHLLGRIDAVFESSAAKVKEFQSRQMEELHGRQQRLEQFDKLLGDLKDIWRPRLEALAKRFGDKVQLTPSVTPSRREATFKFRSDLAHIDLRFSVFTDSEVRNIVFYYDLQILPILMKFDSHAEIEFPIEKVDREQLAAWMDDRIVSFVQTYLSLHENTYYLKGHLVDDPIANVRFPKYAAGATLERDGKTLYFVSEETCQQYVKQHGA